MRRAYAFLLEFYPRDYRAMFAREMRNAFDITAEEIRAGGRAVLLRFAAAELLGLIKGAGSEWIAKLTTDRSVRGRALRLGSRQRHLVRHRHLSGEGRNAAAACRGAAPVGNMGADRLAA